MWYFKNAHFEKFCNTGYIEAQTGETNRTGETDLTNKGIKPIIKSSKTGEPS